MPRPWPATMSTSSVIVLVHISTLVGKYVYHKYLSGAINSLSTWCGVPPPDSFLCLLPLRTTRPSSQTLPTNPRINQTPVLAQYRHEANHIIADFSLYFRSTIHFLPFFASFSSTHFHLIYFLTKDQKKTTSSPISLLPPLLTFNPALLSLLYPFPLLLLCHFYFYSISNISDSFCSISWEDQMMVANGGKKSNRNRPCDSWSMALNCKYSLIDKKLERTHSHFWSYICS